MPTIVPARQTGSVPSSRASCPTLVPSVRVGPTLLFLAGPSNGPQGTANSVTIQLVSASGAFVLQAGVPIAITKVMGDGTLSGVVSGPTNGAGQVTLSAWSIDRSAPAANNLQMLQASAPGYASANSPFFEAWAGRLDSAFGGTLRACGLVATRALAAYNGSLIDLYRLTDMVVQGFGCAYGSDFLDEAAIATWLGTADANIATLYDNTANDYRMKPVSGIPGTQGDAGGPRFAFSGVDGRPIGDMSDTLPGLPRLERVLGVPNPAAYPYTTYTLWQMNSATSVRGLWASTDVNSNQNYRDHVITAIDGFDQAEERHDATPQQQATGSVDRVGAPHVYEGRWVSAVSRSTTVDGDETTDAGDDMGPPDGQNRISIGRRLRFAGSSQRPDGYFVGWAEVEGVLSSAERNSYGEAFAADRSLTWTPLP